MSRCGPDGAVYVADWFDPRTGGHAALDNSFAGAIYRITPKGKKLTTPKIDVSTTAGQIAALKSPAINVRALGFMKLRDAGTASVAPVAALLNDSNPYVRGRAVFLLAQLGREGIAKAEEQLRNSNSMMRIAAFRALRRVNHRVVEHAKTLATDSSPAVRREAAIALRDESLDSAREILLAIAKGYDGKDRAYLEAWGTGCSGKEAEIYRALAANPPDKDPAKWPASYANLIWRLTPAGAEPAFAARAAAKSLPELDRVAAVTALGFIPTTAAAKALLDVAEKGAGMAKVHAMWWLLNYKDIRWKDAGINAALKERKLYDPDTRVDQSEHCAGASPEQDAAGRRDREAEGRREKGRGDRSSLPAVPSNRRQGQRLRSRARRLCESANGRDRHQRDHQSLRRNLAWIRRHANHSPRRRPNPRPRAELRRSNHRKVNGRTDADDSSEQDPRRSSSAARTFADAQCRTARAVSTRCRRRGRLPEDPVSNAPRI